MIVILFDWNWRLNLKYVCKIVELGNISNVLFNISSPTSTNSKGTLRRSSIYCGIWKAIITFDSFPITDELNFICIYFMHMHIIFLDFFLELYVRVITNSMFNIISKFEIAEYSQKIVFFQVIQYASISAIYFRPLII